MITPHPTRPRNRGRSKMRARQRINRIYEERDEWIG